MKEQYTHVHRLAWASNENQKGSLSLLSSIHLTHTHINTEIEGGPNGFYAENNEVYIEDELGQVAAMQTAFWTSVPTVLTIKVRGMIIDCKV